MRLPDISFPYSPPRVSSVYCEMPRKPTKLGPWQHGVREAFSDKPIPLYTFPEWWWKVWVYRTTCTPSAARPDVESAGTSARTMDSATGGDRGRVRHREPRFHGAGLAEPKNIQAPRRSHNLVRSGADVARAISSPRDVASSGNIVIVPKLHTDGEFDLDAAWRPVIKETEERETFWKPSQPARLGGTGENRSRVRRNHVAAEWHARETPLTRCNTLWRAVLRRVCVDALHRNPLGRRPHPGDNFVAWGHTKREYIPTFEDREAARDELLYGIEFADLAGLDEDAIRAGAWKWAELNWSERLKPEGTGPSNKERLASRGRYRPAQDAAAPAGRPPVK